MRPGVVHLIRKAMDIVIILTVKAASHFLGYGKNLTFAVITLEMFISGFTNVLISISSNFLVE